MQQAEGNKCTRFNAYVRMMIVECLSFVRGPGEVKQLFYSPNLGCRKLVNVQATLRLGENPRLRGLNHVQSNKIRGCIDQRDKEDVFHLSCK